LKEKKTDFLTEDILHCCWDLHSN